MPVMRVLEWNGLSEAERERLLARATGKIFDPELREGVVRIVEDVRQRGDQAVVDALAKFDGCGVSLDGLRVSEAEFAAARKTVSGELTSAIREAIGRIRAFNERVLESLEWRVELEPGVTVGEKLGPISSAGLFVPSGKGSFPSTLTQIVTPAVVAGVPEVAVVVPPVPGSDGKVDPAVLVAADELGVPNVFRANGPAGVAALAFGTETFPKVIKVLGPGSPPVQAAQIEVQRYGCDTVMLMGPSESLVVADGSADPRLLAADLLTEAEHGSDSAVLLVTPDRWLLEATQSELEAQIGQLPEPRRSYAAAALGEMGGAVLVDDLDTAVEVANLYAPEHMQIVVSDEEQLLAKVEHAGEVLLGQHTPFSAANYVIGVPAALPTGRYARLSSGITARTFTKATSLAKLNAEALRRIGPAAERLADHEGFPAHAAAIGLRCVRD